MGSIFLVVFVGFFGFGAVRRLAAFIARRPYAFDGLDGPSLQERELSPGRALVSAGLLVGSLGLLVAVRTGSISRFVAIAGFFAPFAFDRFASVPVVLRASVTTESVDETSIASRRRALRRSLATLAGFYAVRFAVFVVGMFDVAPEIASLLVILDRPYLLEVVLALASTALLCLHFVLTARAIQTVAPREAVPDAGSFVRAFFTPVSNAWDPFVQVRALLRIVSSRLERFQTPLGPLVAWWSVWILDFLVGMSVAGAVADGSVTGGHLVLFTLTKAGSFVGSVAFAAYLNGLTHELLDRAATRAAAATFT